MTEINKAKKTLGEQMADLLRRKPKNFDVIFLVGPQKIKVEAVKFILKAASPIFEKAFDEEWENVMVGKGEGIPLPNFDPIAFQLFINLLILDAWSFDSLNDLKLSPNDLLSLLDLCRRYKITKAIENLEEAADDVVQSFDQYKDTDEFLKLSRENLKTIFSFESIPLDEKEIFECACRWANSQCTVEGLEPTGENYRKVLDCCLYQIRFPSMSAEEFTKVSIFKKNILQEEEILAIYEYIGFDIDEKVVVNQSHSFGCSVLSLPQQYILTTSPAFVCDGSEFGREFLVNEKITLHGVGFLGPIDGDTHYNATVRIKRKVNGSTCCFDSGTFKKRIFARKGKIFYLLFKEPITVESSAYDSDWGNGYKILFSLKGTTTLSQYKVNNPQDESFQATGVEFHFHSSWNNGSPLAELLYKKI